MRRARSTAVLAVTMAAALAGFRASGADTGGVSTVIHHVSSVSRLPGYAPLVDPESTSVVIGRRLNAPVVDRPFHGGARSLDDLGRAICRALHHGDRDSLLALCITDDEFRDILWREFPQSRPATGLQWDDAWKILYARLHAGCSHARRDLGGHYYEFLRFDESPPTRYKNFALHQHLVLVVKDDQGRVQQWTWLRAVAERKGRFKIYSTED